MEAIECIKGRRSIRKYTGEKVSRETIEQLIDVARFAPTWKNSQTVRYIYVDDDAMLDKICENCLAGFAKNGDNIKGAGGLMVLAQVTNRCGYERDGSFTTSKEDRWQNFDAGIACEAFCLAAHEKGLGTVIMGIFDDAKVAETIGLPEGQIVQALIAVGNPADDPAAPPRKEVADILSFI